MTSASTCSNGLPPEWCAPQLKAGDTYPALQFAFTSTDTGTALNFPAGTTALAQIRDKRRGALVLAFAATVSGNVVTLSAVPSTTTSTLPQGRHWFELQTIAPGGAVTTWIDSAEIVVRQDHAYV